MLSEHDRYQKEIPLAKHPIITQVHYFSEGLLNVDNNVTNRNMA